MTKDIVETTGVLSAGSDKELWPEGGQLLPARPQLSVVMSGQMPQVLQFERRHDAAHRGGHSEQDPRDLGAGSGRVPGDHQYLVHDLYGKLEGKQARGARGPRLPAVLSARPLPPLRTSELDVGEQKGAAARPFSGRVVKRQPCAAMGMYKIGGYVFAISRRTPGQQLEKPLVEFAHQLQTGRALPLRGRG